MLGIDCIATLSRRKVFLEHDQTVDVNVCPTHATAPYEDVREAFVWALRQAHGSEDE